MGVSLSWVLARGADRNAICSCMSLTPRRQDQPDGISLTRLGQWTLILLPGSDYPLISDERLARLSRGAELVCGWVEEHVNASFAAGWKDGTKMWTVSYDPERDDSSVATTGELPEEFAPFRAAINSSQGDKRLDACFQTPANLTEAITGFHHEIEPEGNTPEELAWEGRSKFDAESRKQIDDAMKVWQRMNGRKQMPWYRRIFG